MLEKDFIYEQISRLTDRLYSKTQACKQDTLLLAKKVCPSPCPLSSALPPLSPSTFHRWLHLLRKALERLGCITREIQRIKIYTVTMTLKKKKKMTLRELTKVSFSLVSLNEFSL